jgi:hypothetical protein
MQKQRGVAPSASEVFQAQRMPFPQGAHIEAPPGITPSEESLTQEEIELLQAVGWKSGDPIPEMTDTEYGKLSAANAQSEIDDDIARVTEECRKRPFRKPSIKPLDELEGDAREDAEQAFNELEQIRKRLQRQPGQAVQFVNDLPERKRINSAEQKGEEEIKSEEPKSQISDKDKAAYIACILGELPRFEKTVVLFGGRVKVTFQTLTPAEANSAYAAAVKLYNEGKLTAQFQCQHATERFKMALGVKMVERGGNIYKMPTSGTLGARIHYFDNELCGSDTLRQAITKQWLEFGRLVKEMEVQAASPNFFAEIE